MLLAVLTTLGGCSSEVNNKSREEKNNEVINVNSSEENKSDKAENKVTNSETTVMKEENDKVIKDDNSKKQDYIDNYFKIEKDLKESLQEKYSGTTVEMREAASTEYETWDSLLNEVYGILQEQLSEEDMAAVRKEQIQWLEIRDSKAEQNSKEYEGGTIEPLVYVSSLAESTKERCYELINNYMR